MGVSRAADQESIVPVEGEFQPLVRAGDDGQEDAHAASRPLFAKQNLSSLWQVPRGEGTLKVPVLPVVQDKAACSLALTPWDFLFGVSCARA